MSAPPAFLSELAAVGVSVQSPWDLVKARWSYPAAIPVLLEWLDRAEVEVPVHERSRFREGIVRSLAVKEAGGLAAPALIREFRRPGVTSSYRWAVGNSLSVVADDGVFADLVELARDRDYGRDREMVVVALAQMQDPAAVDVLIKLLEDPDVAGHAVMALGKLKAVKARPALEPFREHPKAWVRKEAERALAKLSA
jgi:HEAT repeat protein